MTMGFSYYCLSDSTGANHTPAGFLVNYQPNFFDAIGLDTEGPSSGIQPPKLFHPAAALQVYVVPRFVGSHPPLIQGAHQ